MATWSCKFIYSSDENGNGQGSFEKSDHVSENDALSVSRPLHYTITMSSGSSGAETFSSMSESDNLSFSEPSTRAGTPPETPAAIGSGSSKSFLSPTLLMLPHAQFISPTSSRQDLIYDAENESSFSRLLLDLGDSSPLEGPGDESILNHNVAEMMRKRNDVPRDAWMRGAGISLPPPLLQRSRRPPPLDLSAISCSQVSTQERKTPASPVGHESPSTPVKRPFTAPFTKTLDPEMMIDIPQLPSTAPLLAMPKAPRIYPTAPMLNRTPSPLMLPSPCISWPLDESQLPTTPNFWNSISTAQVSSSSPRRRNITRARQVSLGQKIAKLRESSTHTPIPPSLRNSPIFTQVTSPRTTSEFSIGSPVISGAPEDGMTSPPAYHFVGTPLRVHRNPYFSCDNVSTSIDGAGVVGLDSSWPRRVPSVQESGWVGTMAWEDAN